VSLKLFGPSDTSPPSRSVLSSDSELSSSLSFSHLITHLTLSDPRAALRAVLW